MKKRSNCSYLIRIIPLILVERHPVTVSSISQVTVGNYAKKATSPNTDLGVFDRDFGSLLCKFKTKNDPYESILGMHIYNLLLFTAEISTPHNYVK